jgi:hypothetical protein
MFAGQKPYTTWPREMLGEDPGQRDREGAAVPSPAIAKGARPRALPILLAVGLGLAALALLGFFGALMFRPGGAPPTRPQLASATPALPPPRPAPSLPPLVEAVSNPTLEIIEPERPVTVMPPPIEMGVPHQAIVEAAPPPSEPIPPVLVAPRPFPPASTASNGLPPPRPLPIAPVPSVFPPAGYDKWTAIYDISAHTVYLPSGLRLEAHSGLGSLIDDPRHVDESDRGATPPQLYELTLRESLFHGVQALRLTPIGGGFSFNRVGLLAHPYMLGANGDSNGCVAFKHYDAFLHSFQSGEIKRLLVVARLTEDPSQIGRLASLGQGLR